MAGDEIRVGDVVVCVDVSPWLNKAFASDPIPLTLDALYRVTERRHLLLGLRGFKVHAFHVKRFRKLEAAEPCFTEAMRNLLPEPAKPGILVDMRAAKFGRF